MSMLDWTTIGTIASTVAVVMGGFLWLASNIFNLGRMSQRLDQTGERLDSIESDLSDFKREIKQEINNVRTDLNQRMDKLILTIAESHNRP